MPSMKQAFARMLESVAVAIGVVCASLAAAPLAHAQSDADFVAAKAAFERGDWRRLDALAPALAGHVLERYVVYWQLKSRLDDASPDAVQSFLGRFPDGPLTELSQAQQVAFDVA